MLGPLAGAAVLAVADWRAIFWLNLLLGLGLAVGVLVVGPGTTTRSGRSRPRRRGRARAGAAAGRPGGAGRGRHPRAALRAARRRAGVLDAAGAGRGGGRRGRSSPAASTAPAGAVLPLRGLRRLAREVDVVGSALAVVALGSLVWAFAAADPATQVVAYGPVLLPLALVAAVAFVLHERRTPEPVLPLRALRPTGAWGALLVNLLVGVALVAALVDIPLFARNTTTPGDQLGAALVLLRLLVAVPGGGGGRWLAVPHGRPAAGRRGRDGPDRGRVRGDDRRGTSGRWTARCPTVVLLVAGLGFGLAIAPVNAVLLAVTGADVHGSASALAVVARTVGMLGGLSLLTAVALRRFTAEVDAIGTPFELCPDSPADCPAYDAATDAAILTQLHTVFAGAAVAAGLAAVAALLLLRDRSPRRHGMRVANLTAPRVAPGRTG